jgi:uncharacterized protein with FMN-binding domain
MKFASMSAAAVVLGLGVFASASRPHPAGPKKVTRRSRSCARPRQQRRRDGWFTSCPTA